MAEVMKHLRALVFVKRIKENWSHYLPLARRITNYSVDRSTGTQPARVIFRDIVNCDLAMDLPRTWESRYLLDYQMKLPRRPRKINQGHTEDSIEKSAQTDYRVLI